MRRFLRFTSVVALALIGVSGTVAAKSAERPFKGTLSGEVNFVPEAGCPIGLKTVSDAVGTLLRAMLAGREAPPALDPFTRRPQSATMSTASKGRRSQTVNWPNASVCVPRPPTWTGMLGRPRSPSSRTPLLFSSR